MYSPKSHSPLDSSATVQIDHINNLTELILAEIKQGIAITYIQDTLIPNCKHILSQLLLFYNLENSDSLFNGLKHSIQIIGFNRLFTHKSGVCPCSDIDFKVIIDDLFINQLLCNESIPLNTFFNTLKTNIFSMLTQKTIFRNL